MTLDEKTLRKSTALNLHSERARRTDMLKHVAASLGVVVLTSSMAFAGQSGLSNTGTAPTSPSVNAAQAQSNQATAKAKKHKARKHRKHHKKNAAAAKAAAPKQ